VAFPLTAPSFADPASSFSFFVAAAKAARVWRKPFFSDRNGSASADVDAAGGAAKSSGGLLKKRCRDQKVV
jgi:hypothetical protein